MTHAIRMHATGGPDVLRWEEIELAPPGPGEVRVRHRAVGLNFIEIYVRTGFYPAPLPLVPGTEAAGVVEAVGDGVSSVTVGDRVAYASGPWGAYAEARNIHETQLVRLPPDVDERVAAAVMLKGLTAHYLVEMGHLRPGSVVLVHAAAGGVGRLLTQWAKHLGAHVIGTTGSEEKAAIARENGCDEVVPYAEATRVAKKRCDVVYDSVGKDTFAASLECLRPRGLFVSYGQSSGGVTPFEPRVLANAGSVFFVRPILGDFIRTAEELRLRAKELFDVLAHDAVKASIGATFPLRDAPDAHRALEARTTTGATVLLP